MDLLRYFNLITILSNKPYDRMAAYVNYPILHSKLYTRFSSTDRILTIPVTPRDAQLLTTVFLQDNPDYQDPVSRFKCVGDIHRSETLKKKYANGELVSNLKGKSLYCNKRCTSCGKLVLNVRTNTRKCPRCG